MFNDALSDRAPGLMMTMLGTPQFLEDTRRGLFGYEALRSRLCDSRFAQATHDNVSGPVIRLRRLSDDEMFALLLRIKSLHSQAYADSPTLSNEDIERFYVACNKRAGASELMTPREMIRDFLYVLDTLREGGMTTLRDLIGEGDGTAVLPSETEKKDDRIHDPDEIEI
jgi:hypothetical protein